MMAFVLVPQANRLPSNERKTFIASVFPRAFRVASYSIVFALLSGLWLSYLMTGWVDLPGVLATRWGKLILSGGVLGLAIAFVHFFVANQIEARLIGGKLSAKQENRLFAFLRIIPRGGLLVISLVFILMMVAARGF